MLIIKKKYRELDAYIAQTSDNTHLMIAHTDDFRDLTITVLGKGKLSISSLSTNFTHNTTIQISGNASVQNVFTDSNNVEISTSEYVGGVVESFNSEIYINIKVYEQ